MSQLSYLNNTNGVEMQELSSAAVLAGTGAGTILSFDSGSYSPGPTIPPLVLLFSAVGDVAATNSVIGNGMWGPEVALLGAKINLSSLGFPPWPQIVGRDGVITEFAASMDSVAAVEVDQVMALLAPGIELPNIHASLWHAPAPAQSPALMASLDWRLVADMNIGQIPLISAVQRFHGDAIVADYPVHAGDFLIVRFYINSNLIAAAAAGFHAGATVNII